MKPLAVFFAAAFCLAATGVATAQPERPVMLSQVLEAPLVGAPSRPAAGKQQPEIATVKDLLIDGDGQTDVILVAGKEKAGRVVPWNELAYDAGRNDFTFREQGGNLDRFPPWQEPVSETQGSASKVLASKLLNGLVQTPSGERLGEVKDVQLDRNGSIKQVFFRRGQGMATMPWKGIDVQPARPDITASPGAEAVIVVDRKEL